MHVVGTAGHVDHGKSSLVEALTGIDPDRFEEEKRRGLTIDLGFAWCALPSGREIGIVDVPGHERFIRNMLAGAGGVAAGLFVVAADEGWMPQSAEHLHILDFLEVRTGVVALTKADLVDDEILELAADEVERHLEGTSLEGSPVVRVSARTGTGLDDLRAAIDDVLDTAPAAQDRGRARLYVDRSFSIRGSGTVVTGTLTGGDLRTAQEVTILPGGHTGRIRALQTHKRTVDLAVPGSRVAVNLAGLDRRAVARGDALVSGPWHLTDRFAGRLRAARDLRHPMRATGSYALYAGSADTLCRIRFLATDVLRAGNDTLAEVFCDRKLPLVHGDHFVIRDVGRSETVAGGVVLDAEPPGRQEAIAIDRLRRREKAATEELVAILVDERGIVATDELEPATGLSASEVRRQLSSAALVTAQGYVVDEAFEMRLREMAVERMSAHHRDEPLAAGLPSEDLRRHLGLVAGPFSALTWLWETQGIVVRDGARLRLPTHQVELDGAQRAAADRGLEVLRSSGASPPELATVGIGPQLARALEQRGELVILGPELAYPTDVWWSIERSVVDHIAEAGPATVSRMREVIGTTRKYAVPILEHLDATGLTRRRGDLRELGPRGEELTG